MMRTALRTVMLTVLPWLCLAQDTKGKPASPPAAEQQKQETPQANPVQLTPLIPIAPPGEKAADPAGGGPIIPKQAAPVDSKTYVIGAEDVLSVLVFENQGFSLPTEVVRPDGMIALPLIGEVQATGKTPEQLGDEIAGILKEKYMTMTPHVQVRVLQVLSKRYYVAGEVNKPGRYPLVVPTTVMQAIIEAGGFRDFANKKRVRILRGTKTFMFNFKDAAKGKHLEQNILLMPGDQITVN